MHNHLHPFMPARERDWMPVHNPLAPQPPQRAYGHITKHIFLQADQLFYDVDAVTGLIDRASRSATADAYVATSESDTYRPMFFRWFDKYIAAAENILSAFVLKPEGVTRIDALHEWREMDITLLMPDYWDATVYDALAQTVHRFVADGAIYEYLSLTLSSKDQRTLDRKDDIANGETQMRALACRVIPGSVRKHLNPF